MYETKRWLLRVRLLAYVYLYTPHVVDFLDNNCATGASTQYSELIRASLRLIPSLPANDALALSATPKVIMQEYYFGERY